MGASRGVTGPTLSLFPPGEQLVEIVLAVEEPPPRKEPRE
jgi:hypothetical protein